MAPTLTAAGRRAAKAAVCREMKRRSTRFVVVTFCASLTSFFVAGFYDYARPAALYRFVPLVESALRWVKAALFCPECHLGVSAPSAVASTCESPAVRVAARAFVEATVLVPTLLLIFPLTQRKWKDLRPSSSQGMRKIYPREETGLCSLLRVISWMLWAASAVGLLLGIIIGSHQFGIISVSALLAFFAQGVSGVGCLLSSYICDDDDIRQETSSLDESTYVLVRAASWASPRKEESVNDKAEKNNCKQIDSAVRALPCRSSSLPNEALIQQTQLQRHQHIRLPVSPKKTGSLAFKFGTDGVDFDLLLFFFFIKITLLQTPYCLQLGLHLLHNCVNCARPYQKEFDPAYHMNFFDFDGNFILPKKIPAVVVFVCTILVPLFTHGVGGKLFNGTRWSFHHPFDGGRTHVTAQATGWSLVGLAGFLHLAFMLLGMGHQHIYLLHSGSVLSWLAESLLLYSLVEFRPSKLPQRCLKSKVGGRHAYIFVSYVQDFIVTNLHWSFMGPPIMTLFGINFFSLQPTRSFLCPSTAEVAVNIFLLLISWAMPYILISYSPRRKKWKWNIFGLFSNFFEWFICHPLGIFSDSQLRMEDDMEDYQRPGAMFAMAPHGTLPTSVFAVCYQFDQIFSDVCVFFGSQADLCPGYRFLFGMLGGFLPVEKKRLVEVMQSRQSVALVPGGVSEMLHCAPHDKTINVSIKHKGFVRLAIQNGYDLVPTFFFHANDQYNNPMKPIQLWTYKSIGIPIGLPIFTNRWGLPISNRTKIQVALGKRIPVKKSHSPTTEEIDTVHRLFYEEVLRVWQVYKDEFGYSHRDLAYVT